MRRQVILIFVALLAFGCGDGNPSGQEEVNETAVRSNGQALVEGEGKLMVVAHCTGCHSEKLITQNRATREGWLSMIRWMQASQNLWDLGENEQVILDYLEANYSPSDKGRRPNLTGIEWYELNGDTK